MIDKQIEIEIPPQPKFRNYWREHVCKKYKKEKKTLVFMRESVDPRYFIGECRSCKETVLDKTQNV